VFQPLHHSLLMTLEDRPNMSSVSCQHGAKQHDGLHDLIIGLYVATPCQCSLSSLLIIILHTVGCMTG